MSKQRKIRIRLKAFSHKVLDQATKEIVNTVKRIGATVKGPIPLPLNIRRVTVNRSPHIDKKSREQFEMRVHKRVLDIEDAGPQVGEVFSKIKVPAGVEVEIKL